MGKSEDDLEVEAEQIAEQVIKENEFASLPICPRLIAQKNDVSIGTRESKVPGVNGFLMRVGNQFGIYHASHIANEGFIRFTIAHELGHFFLPGHPEAIFSDGSGIHESQSGNFESRLWYERQADNFASSLLMPRDLFTAAALGPERGFSAIRSLKDACQTSVIATAIRYAKLATVPVAVVVSQRETVEYCFMSQAFRNIQGVGWIAKGASLPANCPTRTFNSNMKNILNGLAIAKWTSLDDWFAGAAQVELKEDIVGLGSYGKTLTVLFAG